MKVWVSKYALTDGIVCEHAEKADNDNYVSSKTRRWGFYKLGRAAHLTREEAVSRAEVMRLARIASLKKQIERLERLTFAESEAKP